VTFLEGLLWLTLNVYYEARSEPQVSQVAIVHVTLNRAFAQNKTVKDIVTQSHQFSWTAQKQSYMPNDPKAFMQCMQSVYVALQSDDITKGATHFHSDRVNPGWTSEYTYINHFGSLKFYK
jgi:N-acetylmuramoyl-L-alanine amidase